MFSIHDFMARDHLFCDGFLTNADRCMASQSWVDAAMAFVQFQTLVLQHFEAEESLIFPAFEEATGMHMGPTQVMREEHVQMRQLMDAAYAAIQERDADDYTGYAETLLIMMQQHNLKEETVLYRLCDQRLSHQTGDLEPKLQGLLPGRVA